MPIICAKNEHFFKKWSPEMAYVLGFFAADGSMYRTQRGSHYIEFQITDEDLIYKIRNLFQCDNKISIILRNVRHRPLYRLQIGSTILFTDLQVLGFAPKKTLSMAFPEVPEIYLHHFLRGYFDGDGNVWSGENHKHDRNCSSVVLFTTFICGSEMF